MIPTQVHNIVNRDVPTRHSWIVNHSPSPEPKAQSVSLDGLRRWSLCSPNANAYSPIALVTLPVLLRVRPSLGGTHKSRFWVWTMPMPWHGRNLRDYNRSSLVPETSSRSSKQNSGITKW